MHEWLANKNYVYDTDEIAENSYKEYADNHGIYPSGEEKVWEDITAMRKRVLNVLKKYTQYDKVIVACHGMMIQAITGRNIPKNAEIIEFNYDEHRHT